MSYSDVRLNYNEIDRKIKNLVKFLGSNYKKLGEGCYRAVFDYDAKRVIKCPTYRGCIDDNGVRANLIEYYFYREFKKYKIVPKTSIITVKGIPCILMDKLEMTSDSKKYNRFQKRLSKIGVTMYDGDYQLGLDPKGRVRSCDAGNEDEQLSDEAVKEIDSRTLDIYKKLGKTAKKVAKKK